jgi:hypothetical protein
MMATAAMEQTMIGHMKPPPARMISHIASSLRQILKLRASYFIDQPKWL